MKAKPLLAAIIFMIFLSARVYSAVDSCWVVKTLDNPAPGYIKLGWYSDQGFYLLDNYGMKQYPLENMKINTPMAQKLLKNGMWLCYSPFGEGGALYYILNQSYQIIDSLPELSGLSIDLHDVEVLSNGHYLMLYQEIVTKDMSKIIEGGNINAQVLCSVIIETDKTGTIYWRWRDLDHLDIRDLTPEIDLTAEMIDFSHTNSMCEAPDGNIVLSLRNLDEVIKINRSNGNIIWRFGGKYCKNNQFTFLNDLIDGYTGFSHQHSVSVLPNKNILIFDNGTLKENKYSRVVEYSLDTTNKTATKVWEYRNNPDIYCSGLGSCERLPNGNTLINWVYNKVAEVRPDKSKAYEYSYECIPENENASFYRVHKYVTKMNAVTLPVASAGNFNFKNQTYNTDVTLVASTIDGSGTISVEKHNYSPPKALYKDSLFTSILSYRWVLTNTGIKNIAGSIKLNAAGIQGLQKPAKVKIYKRDKEASGTFTALNTTYNASTGEISAGFSGFGEFVLASFVLSAVYPNEPENQKVNVPIQGELKWLKTLGAVKYQVQASQFQSFSSLSIDKTISSATEAAYSGLKYNTKYFWRVRAINSMDTSAWSEVFSFTTTQIAAPEIVRPVNEFIGLKVSDSLVWKEVEGSEKYNLQLFVNPDFSVIITDTMLTNESLVLEGLDYNTKYYWRLKSIQGTNESPWTETHNFTTTLQPPLPSYPPDDTTNQPLNGFLYWGAVKGSVSYSLELSESFDFRTVLISAKGIGAKEFEYKGLQPNTEYFWRVRSSRSNDTSDWSRGSKFRTLLAAPELVYPAAGSKNIPLNNTFVWDSIKNADSYVLQVSINPDFKKPLADTGGLVNTKVEVRNLPPLTVLYWRMSAVYGVQQGLWSEYKSFTTAEKQPVLAPSLLAPGYSAERYIEGSFEWQPVNDVVAYRLCVASDSIFARVIFDSVIMNTATCRYQGLEFKSKYFWRVKSFESKDSSDWSEVWYFKTQPSKPKLKSPANDESMVLLNTNLSWNPVQEFDFYQLQLSTDTLFGKPLYDNSSLLENSFEVKSLLYNTEYFWRVRYNKNGKWNNWSNIYSFITKSEYPLETPELLNPLDSEYGVPLKGILSWNPVENARSYRATISYDEEFDEIFIRKLGITHTQFEYSGLDYNHLYFWRITAFNDTAAGHWSLIRKFTTELKPPDVIYPPDSAANQPESGFLVWSSTEAAAFYKLQISENDLFSGDEIEKTIINDTTFIYELKPGKKFFWRVKAENSNNSSKWSPAFSFSTKDATSVNEGVESNNISIYPVPAKDVIIISGNACKGSSFSIVSLQGKEIISGINLGTPIDISGMEAGWYYLRACNKKIKFLKF